MWCKLVTLLIAVGASAVNAQQRGPQHNKTVVCYISTWAVYRPGRGSFNIDNFDPSLCTIAIYAFAGLDPANDAIRSLDPWQDLADDGGKAGYQRLTNYKKTHKHLKVLLAIGGWNEGSGNYSELAAHPDRRQRFVKQSLEFIQKHNFDGLDLDWEYPTQRGGQAQDKETFVLLVKELSAEFKKHKLHLSSAFGASKKTIDSAYSVHNLAPYLDTMHIMCYDYFGAWDRRVGLNAPLENDNDLNVKFSIDYFLKLGAPAHKIILGLPFYGRTFITSKDGEGNLGDESDDQGFRGPFTRENGFMGYNEICQALSNTSAEWKTNWDVESSEAVAKVRTLNETHVVTYDSPRSIVNKVRYSVHKGLGGVMVWSIDTDDFQGDCDESLNIDRFNDFRTAPKVKLSFPQTTAKTYPLLRTLNDAIVMSLEEMRQEQNQDKDKENEIDSNESSSTQAKPNKPNDAAPRALSSFIVVVLSLTSVALKML